MAKRTQRAEIAQETVEILERGSYSVDGVEVTLSAMLNAMRRGTILYSPVELERLVDSLEPPERRSTVISVRNCTTFAAARSLIADGYDHPLCLNFASAKNPGGGFLSGSQAQEESLARASGLYASLTTKMAYYEANRSHASSLYTNHMIYSPFVPVFRDDDDRLVRTPHSVAIVTSPAVNTGAVITNEPSKVAAIEATMRTRIRSVLAVARRHTHRAIVLGAWGCGVFRNDPAAIANWFADALRNDMHFQNAFDRVIFGVLDYADGAPTFEAFRKAFGV